MLSLGSDTLYNNFRMTEQILLTKLFVPSPRVDLVPRHRLIERLNNSLFTGCKLTLISAPAGFGKSTLVCDWLGSTSIPIAWLTLDERDKDPARFLAYLVAALQNVKPGIGLNLQAILRSPQPLQIENILTLLINEISNIEENFLIVLDDYHATDSPQVDQSLDFIIEHQPARMHLVIITREDPDLPLARLRGRGQCVELRAADLRFTNSETREYFNRIMKLDISEQEIDALETRTEGWIAGLQMAAISLEGLQDTAGFIQSFTGSHRFVMDYLLEEVLKRQPDAIQDFLQKTSVLDRMCGPLCDALLENPSTPGQTILDYLDHANLFIIPLDNERCWFRYHHLFASLLRKRLGQSLDAEGINRLHYHASDWFENNDLVLEAFRHAAAGNDIERAVRLIESNKMPLHLRGTVAAILEWLNALPDSIRNARPVLWWKQASLLLAIGQREGVEKNLQAAEAAMQSILADQTDEMARDLTGRIAAARANLAQTQAEVDTIFVQARRALEYLHPNNFLCRSAANRALGFAHYWLGEWDNADQAYTEALSLAHTAGDIPNAIMALIGLGQLHQDQFKLSLAAETYQQVLLMIGDYTPPYSGPAYLNLALIFYDWNDLDASEQYILQGLKLAQMYDQIVDRTVMGELYLALIKIARKDLVRAEQLVSQALNTSHQKNFNLRIPNIAYFQALIHIRQGSIEKAAQLVRDNDLPLMRARVLTIQNDPAEALTVLEPLCRQAEEKGWTRRLLDCMAVQAIAHFKNGDQEKAVEELEKVLAIAEPEGIIRLFLDEGALMAELLSVTAAKGIRKFYISKLLAAFEVEEKVEQPAAPVRKSFGLVDPLTPRELEILRLLDKGFSNQQICKQLFLALDTVKGHNRRIFEKLQVHQRTEALARARELGLL